MGLMDKVKAQATQLAQKTQDTAREGKARLDQAQANRRADVLLRNLGALVYSERTGRAAADSQQQLDKLVAEISAHEAENGINLARQSAEGWTGGLQGQTGPPAGPQSYTDPAAPATTPDAGQTSTFPEAGPAAPPAAGPTTSPDASQSSFPDTGATSFPPSADDAATSFPPQAEDPQP